MTTERDTNTVPSSAASTTTESSRKPLVKFSNRTRYLVLALVTLCLSVVQSNALTLNFTVICMADPMPDIKDFNASGRVMLEDNGTYFDMFNSYSEDIAAYEAAVASRQYAYSSSEKSQLFSVVALGAMASVYPIMLLIQWFGTRRVVTLFGIFSAIVTAFLPLFASWGFGWLIALRVLQGVPLGMNFSMIGILTSNWATLKQSAFFIAILTAFFQFGPIFTMPVSGALCTSQFGWQSVYYVHAVVSLALFVAFYFFYREFPNKHFCVSTKELGRIQKGKDTSGGRQPVPYKAILSTHAIYVIWASAIANFMGIQVTMQFSPTYLNKVLGFPIGMTGLFSSIPQIVTFFVKVFAGVLSDKARCCTPLTSTKIFNHVAIGGMGLLFFVLAFIPASAPILGLVVLILCTSIVGFNCGAFFKASQLLARQHNHFIMTVNSFFNCLSSLLAPVIVNSCVREDTEEEWRWVWIIFGVLMTICNIYFAIFGKAEPAGWTKKPENASPEESTANCNSENTDPENQASNDVPEIVLTKDDSPSSKASTVSVPSSPPSTPVPPKRNNRVAPGSQYTSDAAWEV